MKLSAKALNRWRIFWATLSGTALVACATLFFGGVASAMPTSHVAENGFVSLGINPALCDDPSTPKVGDGTDYNVASGIRVQDAVTELRLEYLVGNTWTVVADDGVEVLLNDEPVDGHGALWAHVKVGLNDKFEIRHHTPFDGNVRTYRLLAWPSGDTQPFVLIDKTERLSLTEGFCEEILAAGGVSQLW